MKWTRKTAEEAVKFYSGLIERGSPLTVEEQRDLKSAAQFLRQVRKRPAFQNPRKRYGPQMPKGTTEGFPLIYRSYTINKNLVGDIWVEKDGFRIAWAESLERAKGIIDNLLKENPRMRNPKIPTITPMVSATSWYAYLEAARGSLLLGGVRKNRSSRFSTWEDAKSFLLQAIEANTKAGRKIAVAEIRPTAKPPEIGKVNSPTKIYGKVLQIKAEKQSGPFKGQRFFHDFKNATAYGLPNGDIIITSRKKI